LTPGACWPEPAAEGFAGIPGAVDIGAVDIDLAGAVELPGVMGLAIGLAVEPAPVGEAEVLGGVWVAGFGVLSVNGALRRAGAGDGLAVGDGPAFWAAAVDANAVPNANMCISFVSVPLPISYFLGAFGAAGAFGAPTVAMSRLKKVVAVQLATTVSPGA